MSTRIRRCARTLIWWPSTSGNQYKCLKKLRAAVSARRRLVTDYFMPVRWAPESPLQNYLALGLANNVKDRPMQTRGSASSGSAARRLWQAALEHPGYDQLPTDDRLLLCCCMNIDEKHPFDSVLKHYIDPQQAPRGRHARPKAQNSSTRSPSDAHDPVWRVAPHADRDTPIEGRLNFACHTGDRERHKFDAEWTIWDADEHAREL